MLDIDSCLSNFFDLLKNHLLVRFLKTGCAVAIDFFWFVCPLIQTVVSRAIKMSVQDKTHGGCSLRERFQLSRALAPS